MEWIPCSATHLALGPAGMCFPCPISQDFKHQTSISKPSNKVFSECYDASTDMILKHHSKNKHQSCNDVDDWYNALGNVTQDCGTGWTGYFHDAQREMAWYVHHFLL